jgi:hypothetical protein
MSIASSVKVENDGFIIEDDDGGVWRFVKKGEAPEGAKANVDYSWQPVGNPPTLIQGPDGKAVLRQSEKGLPQTMVAYLAGNEPLMPLLGTAGGWGSGLFEFRQV